MKKLLTFICVAVTLAGCDEQEVVRSVDWYKDNATERQAMVAQCRSNPGQSADSPNCVNAQQAETALTNARRGWIQPNPIN